MLQLLLLLLLLPLLLTLLPLLLLQRPLQLLLPLLLLLPPFGQVDRHHSQLLVQAGSARSSNDNGSLAGTQAAWTECRRNAVWAASQGNCLAGLCRFFSLPRRV